jgi:hypothetical protein
MGKPSVIEEQRPEAAAEAAVVTCRHHWVIETPRGSMSQGRCKRCGEEREFRNSAQDHLWEDDSGSGSGYNPWRGARPARGGGDDEEVAASSGPRQAMIA